jgi:hypothetical protein
MILEDTTRTFDSAQTLAQIGRATLMACGARDIKVGPDKDNNGTLTMRVNHSRKHQYIVIRLMPNDLYQVECVFSPPASSKRMPHLQEFKENVFCEDLSEVVYHMVNK